jgi:protein-tyrosine phosphatase
MERTSVLFVCLGNICRSPLAEGIFRHLVNGRDLGDRFAVDSAGTGAWHVGDPPDPRSTAVARRFGVRLGGRARQLRNTDLQEFDLVLAMDQDNLRGIETVRRRSGGDAEVRLLREFDPASDGDLEVPDPYYGGERGFEDVYEMVFRSCETLLDQLIDRWNP